MVSRADKHKLIYIVCVLGVCTLFLCWWTGRVSRVIAGESNERTKAQALVAAYSKHVGAHDEVHRTLDEDDDRSFGDFGFHYFPKRDTLQARVYIVRSLAKERPEFAEGLAKVDAALNDPKLGGMYDRGGGYFFLDKQKQITFLAKDYKVSSTNSTEFIRDVDNLNDLAGLWITNWFGHLADQTYGREPMPKKFATRENNPYPRQ